ncbi:hypothetical protein AK830_g4468 [Neonectria ditissima]|uniref:RING-type domain-containing protein n=1 Tax=Neonectria ditissima TaxID=78410 RepID=A0A0P7B6C5_9HYPO|nr:hypothetical protein AK830_g4468 [Neonectria ditissima]
MTSCNQCGQVFASHDAFRMHFSNARPSPVWKCDSLCGRAFDTREALADHQRTAPLHHVLHRHMEMLQQRFEEQQRQQRERQQRVEEQQRQQPVQGGEDRSDPAPETNMPFDIELERASRLLQHLTLRDTPAIPRTPDPITRQDPAGSEASSRSSNSFSPRPSATLAHSLQSSQPIRPVFDNGPVPEAEFTFHLDMDERFQSRKTLTPVSPAERVARSLAKLPVFGPPSLQEEMVAMSAKMTAMESELRAAKDALRRKDSQRECVMCFERKVDSVTKCGHQFCGGCIVSWQSQHRTPWQTPCPVCRKAMGKAIRVYDEPSVGI